MIEARITGLPDLREALATLVPKLRVRALRNALAAGAREVQREARAATPVISASSPAVRKGYRKPGTVRKAISVRTSKVARQAGDVGVFVNVRPAKGAKYRTTTTQVLGVKVRKRQLVRASQRGAKSPDDPFYWRFLNFDPLRLGFLQRGAERLPEALQIFIKAVGPAIAKLNKPKAPAP